jgi:hypothetical protein
MPFFSRTVVLFLLAKPLVGWAIDLQPNDIVYVEPNKLKFVESNVAVISLVTSITSTISILVLFINNLGK